MESDSSGVFLSLSNQSQEEGGSDSDHPISGSDLGSSNTSLEKDGDDGGLKEWGREESAELQWCYPSLLNTSMYEEMDVDGERGESGLEVMGADEKKENKRRKYENEGNVSDMGMVPINKTLLDHTDIEDSMALNAPQSEKIPTRKKVTIIGSDSPFPLSPSKKQIKHLPDPYQKPIRSSGLDCGDIDPFVQSDSFVYLAVSAKPACQGEVLRVTGVPTDGTTKSESIQQLSDSTNTNLNQTTTDAKLTQNAPQKPKEGDFLCTDSFVYLAAPACLLLGPAGTTTYSGRYVHFFSSP